MQTTRILIVEDETIIGMEIRLRLVDVGYDVIDIIPCGEVAIEKAQTLHPDLILMDIHLAGEMDGITAAEHIRQNTRIPIIFLTAHTDDRTLQRAKVQEPFAYLVKPFQERELDIAIQMALYKHEIDAKLRASEERLRILIESTDDIIFSQDINGVFTYYHGSSKYGLTSDDVVGKTPVDIFDEYIATDMMARNQEVIASDTSITIEIEIPLRNGKNYWFNQNIYPLKDSADKTIGVATVSRNITDIKRLKGILPVCAWCGSKVKDDSGDWKPLDVYLIEHSEVQVSHGMCPNCQSKYINPTSIKGRLNP